MTDLTSKIFIAIYIILGILMIASIITFAILYCYKDNNVEKTKLVLLGEKNDIIPSFININNKISYHLNAIKTSNIKINPRSKIIIYSLPSGKIFNYVDSECTNIFYSGDYLLISDNKFDINIIE